MSNYFLDTSALAKHYHLETGTAEIERILNVPSGSHFISRLSTVEIQSVFALKVRTQVISSHDLDFSGIAASKPDPSLDLACSMGSRGCRRTGAGGFHRAAIVEDARRDSDSSLHRPSRKREPGNRLAYDAIEQQRLVNEAFSAE